MKVLNLKVVDLYLVNKIKVDREFITGLKYSINWFSNRKCCCHAGLGVKMGLDNDSRQICLYFPHTYAVASSDNETLGCIYQILF